MSWWGDDTKPEDTDSRASWGNSGSRGGGSSKSSSGCDLWLILILATVVAICAAIF